MRRLIILMVFLCGIVIAPTSAFSFDSESMDLYITPKTNPNFFGGYVGGDGDFVSDPDGYIDWSIGNSRPYSGVLTEDLVFSTNIGDYNNSDDWKERMRITQEGNVGIGTTDPGAELEVNGNIIANNPTDSNHVATKAYVDAQAENGEPYMITSKSAGIYTHADAVKYCRDLSAPCQYRIDGYCYIGYDFTDWKLPTAEQLALFEGMTTDTETLWTRTVYGDNYQQWINLSLTGYWRFDYYNTGKRVRCVR